MNSPNSPIFTKPVQSFQPSLNTVLEGFSEGLTINTFKPVSDQYISNGQSIQNAITEHTPITETSKSELELLYPKQYDLSVQRVFEEDIQEKIKQQNMTLAIISVCAMTLFVAGIVLANR
jgi:ABC-type antimicrobial peptide transport system permease subunit